MSGIKKESITIDEYTSGEVIISPLPAMVLRDFLGEHWRLFINHADDYGMQESECEQFYDALDE